MGVHIHISVPDPGYSKGTCLLQAIAARKGPEFPFAPPTSEVRYLIVLEFGLKGNWLWLAEQNERI